MKQDLVDAGLTPAENIPDVNKQMVLFKSDQLKRMQNAAHALDVVGTWMPVLTVVLGAAGVFLAYGRRRALAKTALGAAGAALIVAIGLVVARHYYLDHLPRRCSRRRPRQPSSTISCTSCGSRCAP
ncbi:hypothetical protein ACRAWF_20070 [Streptomyces sp. L7]